jgi:hypothetical protein
MEIIEKTLARQGEWEKQQKLEVAVFKLSTLGY